MTVLKIRDGFGSLIFDSVNYLLLSLLLVVTIYPLLNLVSISLSNPTSIDQGIVSWFPHGFNTTGYEVILNNPKLYISYKNTIFYAAAGTFLTLLLTSLLAYPLAIKEYQGRTFLGFFLAFTMFFSGGLIPTYLLIQNLHMLNTFWVMVVPSCISAFNVIMFRTFFQGIPIDMRESAFMDGANDLRILFLIYLPLSKPLLATIGLFSIVYHWNEWFSGLIYLQDQNKYPLQMFLRSIVFEEQSARAAQGVLTMIQDGKLNPKNIQLAAIVITMAPVLCIYPFIQKYFVKGAMIGAVKG